MNRKIQTGWDTPPTATDVRSQESVKEDTEESTG